VASSKAAADALAQISRGVMSKPVILFMQMPIVLCKRFHKTSVALVFTRVIDSANRLAK
jgi:hypothetical protein